MEKQHNHALVYSAKCPHSSCTDTYIRVTARRLNKQVANHGGRETKSILLKHASRINHSTVEVDNLFISQQR